MKNIINLIASEDILDGMKLEPRKIEATWTGRFPALCRGEWVIKIDGDVVDIPEDVRQSPMNTRGTYSSWHFEAGYREVWETYSDGLNFEPWLKENRWWVDSLFLTPPEERALYYAIQKQDWRHWSCGGCI